MRFFLKKIIPEFLWPFLRVIDKYIIGVMYFFFAIRYRNTRDQYSRINTFHQSVPVYPSKILFGKSGEADVTTLLDQYGITYKAGRHSAYIAAKDDLRMVAHGIDGKYPEPFGLKVIKSRQLSPDSTPYYTSEILAPASTRWSMEAVGSLYEKVIVSNLLHDKQVAPRVHDLVKLVDRDGNYHFALVVEHVKGDVLHGDDGLEFVNHFKDILSSFGMSTISISEHSDLRPPLFRDNIVRSDRGIYYVDIQNFVIVTSGITDRAKESILAKYSGDPLSELMLSRLRMKSDENIVQQVEATRDALCVLVGKEKIQLQDCLVVDGCKGIGTCLQLLLGSGARWGVLLRPVEDHEILRLCYNLGGITRVLCATEFTEAYHKSDCSWLKDKKILAISDQGFSAIIEIACLASCSHVILVDDGSVRDVTTIEQFEFSLLENLRVKSETGVLLFSCYRRSCS